MSRRDLRRAFVLTVSASAAWACQPQPQPLPGNPPLPRASDAEPPHATSAPTPVEPTEAEPTNREPTATSATPTPTTTPDAQPSAPQPAPTTTSKLLNPTTASGRLIRRAYQGDSCFVYDDFPPLKPGEQRYPGTEPPHRDVPCPPAFRDPAYETCRGGTLERRGDGCRCFHVGNPPRVSPNLCPRES